MLKIIILIIYIYIYISAFEKQAILLKSVSIIPLFLRGSSAVCFKWEEATCPNSSTDKGRPFSHG